MTIQGAKPREQERIKKMRPNERKRGGNRQKGTVKVRERKREGRRDGE